MNKIFKYLIGIGVIFTVGINLCNANGDLISTNKFTVISTSSFTGVGYVQGSGNLCIVKPSTSSMSYNTGNGNVSMDRRTLYCFTGGNITVRNSNSYDLAYGYFDLSSNCPSCPTCPTCPTIDQNYCTSNNLCPSCPSCPTCDDPYTSLECQTKYDLIPISSVTKSYCELNFNLIDPSTCPINEGTGIVNWSSLFINNTQYAGNDNIEIFIPDFIGWSIIYNSGTNYIDIEGYNADEDYINTIIDNTKVTPTPEDATTLAQGLTEFIPYIFISMIVLYTLYLIRKLFKS